MNASEGLRKQIRTWIVFFMAALFLSGMTAFPIEAELSWICSGWPEQHSAFYDWLKHCSVAINSTNADYPFLAYGYDWLAFAHIIIAIAFVGPLKDAVRNIWIIQFGIIACALVIPLAVVAGHIREIPVFWRIIDCSFGVVGLIPLTIIYRKTRRLEIIDSSKPNKI